MESLGANTHGKSVPRLRKRNIPVKTLSGRILFFSPSEIHALSIDGRIYEHVTAQGFKSWRFCADFNREQRRLSGHRIPSVTKPRLNAPPSAGGGSRRTRKPMRAIATPATEHEFRTYRRNYVDGMTI